MFKLGVSKYFFRPIKLLTFFFWYIKKHLICFFILFAPNKTKNNRKTLIDTIFNHFKTLTNKFNTMTPQEEIALEKYNKGEKFSVSTFIDEDTIILGYGKLNYDFEFPLPAHITIKEYGTQSWAEYFRLKGLNKYISTNLKTLETTITPYFTREEFLENQKLNPNFTYQIL